MRLRKKQKNPCVYDSPLSLSNLSHNKLYENYWTTLRNCCYAQKSSKKIILFLHTFYKVLREKKIGK